MMNYSIEVDSEGQIIKIESHGSLDQELRKKILLHISGIMKNSGFSRAIIDVRNSKLRPGDNMLDAASLASYMADIGFPDNSKLAFLYSDSEDHRKFFENMAKLKGYKLKYFKDFSEAANWLK